MNNRNTIAFRCIEVTQPIGTYYLGAIDSKDLVRISHADVRTIEEEDVGEYLGIQRQLKQSRVAEISEYVKTIDACFPSSVILAISSDKVEYDRDKGIMQIADEEEVAKIIDGQHRIAGLQGFAGENFQLNTTLFIDMDMEDQAMVFATVNLKQTRVSKSLAYDLYEYATSRSPQKSCHNIAKLLSSKTKSPMKDRVKILGVATGKAAETLSQATVVEWLLHYISDNPMKDRDVLKRGGKLGRVSEEAAERLIFRGYFVDGKDAQIAKILWNYFEAIRKRWPQAWNSTESGDILGRTTGFVALMRFLRPAYLAVADGGGVPELRSFTLLFERAKLTDDQFTRERFLPGAGGQGELYRTLCAQTGLEAA